MSNLKNRIERLEQTEDYGQQRQERDACRRRQIEEGMRRVFGLGPDDPLPTEEELLRRDLGLAAGDPMPPEAVEFLNEMQSPCLAPERAGDALIAALEEGRIRACKRHELVARFIARP
jgi:hypothetical protein